MSHRYRLVLFRSARRQDEEVIALTQWLSQVGRSERPKLQARDFSSFGSSSARLSLENRRKCSSVISPSALNSEIASSQKALCSANCCSSVAFELESSDSLIIFSATMHPDCLDPAASLLFYQSKISIKTPLAEPYPGQQSLPTALCFRLHLLP